MISMQAVIVEMVGGPEVRGNLKELGLDRVVLQRENPEAHKEEDCVIEFDMALVNSIRRDVKIDLENAVAQVGSKKPVVSKSKK